jgi:hypothetical protein
MPDEIGHFFAASKGAEVLGGTGNPPEIIEKPYLRG